MDASYKIQRGIHVHLIQFFMCPEFWVHISALCAGLRFRIFSQLQAIHHAPQGGLHPVPAHHGGYAHAQAVDAVLALEQVGHREHRVLVPHDGADDALHRHGHAIVGGPLTADDLIGAVPHLPLEPLVGLVVLVVAPQLAEVIQGDAGHVGPAPHRQLAVPVLADDEGAPPAGT